MARPVIDPFRTKLTFRMVLLVANPLRMKHLFQMVALGEVSITSLKLAAQRMALTPCYLTFPFSQLLLVLNDMDLPVL